MAGEQTKARDWPLWLLALSLLGAAVAVYLLATQLRLSSWTITYDYDEGVYWQTLEAMAAGGVLYRDIFFSQPPLFMGLIAPLYQAFGETLFAARLAMTVLSLAGLAGGMALGWILAGRAGALVAVLALASSWPFMRAGIVVQADGPSVMLHLPALAAAFWWWRTPRAALAMLCGAAVAASIMIKLLGVGIVLPVALVAILALAESRADPALFRRRLIQLLLAILAGLLVVAASLGPHLADWAQLVRQVVTFHVDAQGIGGVAGLDAVPANLQRVTAFLRANAGLGLAALAGVGIGLVLRPRPTLILLVLLAGDVTLLLLQTPIFDHHFFVLVPPLAALAACAVPPVAGWTRAGAALLLAAVVLLGQLEIARSVTDLAVVAAAPPRPAIADIATQVAPGKFVVTDDQFIAGLAGRRTPPWLVDTSRVRIVSGYLDAAEFCAAIADPAVAAIYLGTGRIGRIPDFTTCIAAHYVRHIAYSETRSLWLRMPGR